MTCCHLCFTGPSPLHHHTLPQHTHLRLESWGWLVSSAGLVPITMTRPASGTRLPPQPDLIALVNATNKRAPPERMGWSAHQHVASVRASHAWMGEWKGMMMIIPMMNGIHNCIWTTYCWKLHVKCVSRSTVCIHYRNHTPFVRFWLILVQFDIDLGLNAWPWPLMTSKPIANVMGIVKLFENDTSNVFLGRQGVYKYRFLNFLFTLFILVNSHSATKPLLSVYQSWSSKVMNNFLILDKTEYD